MVGRFAPGLAVGLLAALCGCSSIPVRVEPASPTQVQRELTSNILNGDEPSVLARQALQRHGQAEVWERDPPAALAELHRREGLTRGGFRLFALAELSYAWAQESGDKTYYLAAAVYAYTLLFPGDDSRPPLGAADPRVRLACEIYNRGLAEALRGPDGEIELVSGTRLLPFGAIDISFSEDELYWGGYRLAHFVPAADLRVYGLRNRYRRAGVGAPLVAGLSREAKRALDADRRRVSEDEKLPVTAFLRIAQPQANLRRGWFEAKLELYSEEDAHYEENALVLEVDGQVWPVEFETSSALATTLADSPWWEFEWAGFFSAAVSPFRDEQDRDDGLLLVHPYRPGRIPVVLVHGTASSPARWADLINELENDRDIWDRYQVWLYIYNSGSPVNYSAGLLRQALDRAVTEFDPAGKDTALRRMVVIGHSQGGLLAKLLAVDSGEAFWLQASDEPFDQLKMSPETRAILLRTAFFTPAPYVSRVIFVCTPHRGSYLAAFSLARYASSYITVPADLTKRLYDVVTLNEGKRVLNKLKGLPTSLDNMSPRSDFIEALAIMPIAPGIKAHSIIAVDDDGPLEDASDGVVSYQSAHIDGVESEKIVRSSHSAQGSPDTIEEIRRILLEHAAQNPP